MATNPPSTPGIPVLVVEDDPTISGLIGALLRRDGFATTVLRDGREAIDHVAREAPSAAVVLDIMLPHRDGFAIAEAIRADPRWREVPVVILSAHGRPPDLERARALGIVEYLVKPFHPQELVGALRRLLAGRAP